MLIYKFTEDDLLKFLKAIDENLDNRDALLSLWDKANLIPNCTDEEMQSIQIVVPEKNIKPFWAHCTINNLSAEASEQYIVYHVVANATDINDLSAQNYGKIIEQKKV